MKKAAALLLLSLLFLRASAQQDLLNMLDSTGSTNAVKQKKEDVTATFKTTRVVTGQSIELNHGGVLNFFIQHRFGRVNQGAYEFFGLDQASVKICLDMGITNRLNVGIGRSSIGKIYDGSIKYKILKQKIHGCPVTLTYYGSAEINSTRFQDPERQNYFSSRMYFTNQLLIGSRITPSLSVQLSPTLVHRNLITDSTEKNDIVLVGIGARQKISKRVSINFEYYYILPNQIPSVKKIKPSLSIGFDIETGGHVFQLHATNSNAMDDKGFMTETTNDWFKGDIILGFNISRVFTMYQWRKSW